MRFAVGVFPGTDSHNPAVFSDLNRADSHGNLADP
jgi:hypothetical protein